MSKELIKAGLELLQNPKIEAMDKNEAIKAFKSISHALNHMHEFVRGSYSIVDGDGSIYKMLFDLTQKINADIEDDVCIAYSEIFLMLRQKQVLILMLLIRGFPAITKIRKKIQHNLVWIYQKDYHIVKKRYCLVGLMR